ncbi:MAG: UDP-N-acetylglucosamine 2-epimerase (non-hydrolyzing) [Leptospira sp.]|nr:UDP-N-acetylglucosamine 2-epimerase (non-hydrolyzing) [Leptospira sp.]
MIKLLTIIGARPQIIKASAMSRAIRNNFSGQIFEVLVHTGQHYDASMSQVFFDELEMTKENYNLQVGSGSHAVQTSQMMVKIEEILNEEKPNAVLLYGDTNSTLAAAVTAAKLHIPIIHVEGGVRSFNKKFPEEVNRLLCDHLSTLIFVPTHSGINNLLKEGFNTQNTPPYTSDNAGVFFCGDIMYDNSLYFGSQVEKRKEYLVDLGVQDREFALVTLHRPSNVDDPEVLANLLKTFLRISKNSKLPFVFPMHPRTKKIFEEQLDKLLIESISESEIHLVQPASFIEMTLLENRAQIIFTDSGGVQKEAYYFNKPCVILLEETPWPELIESGTAILTGSSTEKIENAFSNLMSRKNELTFPTIFGDGQAASFICKKIIASFSS